MNAPVDEDNVELLATLALAITGDRVARPQLMFLLDTARLRGASLEDAERAGREASILRWFALQYSDVGGVTIERAAALEDSCGSACRRAAAGRGRVADDRALPLVRTFVRAVVPAVRPLRRDRIPRVI